jgi:sulfonate dioxygenase
MATTTTTVQEATNAEGQPIKLTVAYDDKIHNEVNLPVPAPLWRNQC